MLFMTTTVARQNRTKGRKKGTNVEWLEWIIRVRGWCRFNRGRYLL